MKKTTLLVLLMVICLGMTACSNHEEPENTTRAWESTRPWVTTGPEETLTPVYTRPQEEETLSEEEIFLEKETFPDEELTEEGDDAESSNGGDSGSPDTGTAIIGGSAPSQVSKEPVNLTLAAIQAYPIKSSTMSVTQLRNLCVDFFRFAKTALWTPSQSIQYTGNDSMSGDKVYGGLPYVSMGNGTVYRLIDYLNEETGVVDLRDALTFENGQPTAASMLYFGNQCSYGSFVGWGRVINSCAASITAHMTKAKGYIPLGEYTYDTDKITTWKKDAGYRTADVVKENGTQVMFRSYAKLQPADGLVNYTTAGHVIMSSSAAHVEYLASGEINGNKSYITIIDQSGSWEDHTTSAGRAYRIKNSVDAKLSFQQLFDNNYVPFTFGEFLGTDPVEDTVCRFSHTGGTITTSQLFSGSVTANYGITDVYVTVDDSTGLMVYKHAVRNTTAFAKTLNMAASGANVDSWGTLNSGTYKVKIEAQLSTGERPVIYTGMLTVS